MSRGIEPAGPSSRSLGEARRAGSDWGCRPARYSLWSAGAPCRMPRPCGSGDWPIRCSQAPCAAREMCALVKVRPGGGI